MYSVFRNALVVMPRLLRQGSANLPLRLETVVSRDSEIYICYIIPPLEKACP